MYEASNKPFPFWGAETNRKTGRDPLAVQNSSVVIYDNMVKGVTNMTVRIRYNGFFCWLMTFIAERLQATNPAKIDNPKEQIKFIRRGELLLAYAMQYNYPLVNGVSGSIFAQRNINAEVLNLAEGADIENKPKVYWQNRLGVFGQYFIGVLTQLKLIFLPDANHLTYRVTSEGLRLCEIFRQSLSKKQEDLFWDSISSGLIARDKLAEFKCLALHLIDNKDELAEYESIFSKPERQDITGHDISHRISTIKLLLKYIQNEGASVDRRQLVLSFLKSNFLSVLNSNLEVTEEQLSWFLYELNELSHAAYEGHHFALLYSTTEEPQPLDVVLDRLEEGYNNYNNATVDGYGIYELYEELQSCYKEKAYGAVIYVASRLLVALYNATNKHLNKLLEYANDIYDVHHPGFGPSLLIRLVGDENKKIDWSFAEDCIYSAINEHLRSSYSKSSIGQGIVHNYMVDDGLIWQLRRPDPIRTSPRLQNVLQYIEDIKWIERNGEYYAITERGTQILMQQ
ncbi:MAG: hypothetical protein IJ553_05815 [Alloprevotella sp.]|nr:hypothetical protein [Alloprevotella sp.]